jgi:prevent-host-death family protein
MQTMTSLEAQNRFGEMIDTSQREPVLITRRGRPVSFVISAPSRGAASGSQASLLHFMKLVAELAPLRGKEAADAYAAYSDKLDNQAKTDGLTEEQITALVHASR